MEQITKYLIFNISEEFYAIPISKVQEVIQFLPITSLHNTNNYLKGVINLRGKIIPIIDMRLKFGLEEVPYNERTIFIITEITGLTQSNSVGLAVDKVIEVIEIEDEKLAKTPDIGFKSRNKYLQGIFQKEDKMVMVLNIDNILAATEVIELNEQIKNQ